MKKTAYPIKEFFSKGAHLASPWDNLSIREKAEMMKVAVRNGITDLPTIKSKYNEFAEGGEIESPVENSNIYAGGSYLDIAKQHIKKNEDWLAKPYRDAPKGKNWRSVGYGFNDSGFRSKYPQGISKHYENGITEAQAEEELNWFLGGVVNHLKKVYGKKWDSFNDNQKAAVIDTYYQRPASVVGKGSRFYKAVMAGDKNAGNYLGVAGYGNRNKDRRKLFGASQIESVVPTQEVLPISEPIQSMPEDTVDFIPWNPQAFFGVNNNTPIIIQQEAPVVEEKMPTPEEIERQERQQGLANFQTIMGMLNNTSDSTSTTMTPFESTVSMLTQQSPIHYFSDGGSISIKPENRGKFTRLKERTGHPEGDNNGPKFKESQEAYYDKDTDTIYAPDSTGEFYHHEMFHARPNSIELERLKPYYENLDDNRLLELGADLPFIKRIDNDPGHFYSPEEVGARVSAAKYMLNNAGINKVDNIFLEEARKNENAYGNNFRDLLHMYNDDNLIGIFNNSYSSGGKIYIKPSHRGRFTALKERTGHSASWFKENGTPAQKKMATFALNSRHWKHGDGGDMHIYNGGELPETTVTAYAPLRLTTHYPITSEYYPYTGHSELDIPIDRKTWYDYTGDTISSDRLSPYLTIDKTSSAKDYNLVTNNCADATLKYLNAAFGTSEKPWLFTTPGDVRDYALKKLNGKLIKNLDGSDTVLIPRNAKIAAKLSKTALNMFGSDKETAYISLLGPFHRHGLGGNLFEDGGTKAGISVDYLDPSEVMPLVADNMGKSIVLDEQVVTPYKKLPMQSDFFEGITNQAANEKADEHANRTSLTPERFIGLTAASVPLAAGALGAVVAAPVVGNALMGSVINPVSDYIGGTAVGQMITRGLSSPYVSKGIEAAFAGHGLNHAINEGIDGYGDAAMTALELTPLASLAKPVYKGVVQPGMTLFNSPLTGKWAKFGSGTREYRLNPNILGANGSLIESRKIGDYSTGIDLNKMRSIFENYEKGLTQYKGSKSPSNFEFNYEMPKIDFDNLVKDDFVDYLSQQTGRTLKRVPIKDTKHGDIYNEGFAFVDDKGKELAHIAGRRKGGKNVFVESSYVDPEFRYKGLGKQMYFDLNDHVFSNYGTTLHSDPMQRVGSTGVGMSPSNRLWKSLRDNGISTVEGEGFNRYDVMAEPSKITTAYRTPSTPQITAENAASVTPEQWTALQDAAIARGNMTEALRLRDLHFDIKAENNKAVYDGSIIKSGEEVSGINSPDFYHNTDAIFNSFDVNRTGQNWKQSTRGGKNGVYLSAHYPKSYYGKNKMRLRVYSENPQIMKEIPKEDAFSVKKGTDVVWEDLGMGYGPEGEVFVLDPRKIKSADAVTFDDNGVRIPLGERDNFNVNDIRWSWLLPIFGVGAGAAAADSTKALGGNLFEIGGPKNSKKKEEPEYMFDSTRYTYPNDTAGLLAEQVVTLNGNYPVLNPKGGEAWTIEALNDLGIPLYTKTSIPQQSFEGKTNQAAKEEADAHANRVAPTAEDLFTIGTLGGLNNLSPTQWVRRAYDLGEAIKGNMSWDNFGNNWFYGNNGLVSDKYAQEHPYASTAINLVGDAGAFGTLSALRKLPKYATLIEAENKAAQEAAALNWRDMFSNSARRTKLGDVEIDNPGLNYRVGTPEMVDDFIDSGKVRAGKKNYQKPRMPGRFLLTKEAFQNPMFKQGSLWYQPSEEMSGLLVTPEELVTATKSSAPVANNGVFTIEGKTFINDFGGRRIPGEGQILDASNTSAYRWKPGYGYRRVVAEEAPTVEWADAANMTPKVNWDADNWFKTISGRSSYSSEEAAELASHVPEYRAIEQRLFNEGKLIYDSNGNIIVDGYDMSPQEYIMRQSEAFQKMNPEHHYVGVSKRLRDNFENEARDPNTRNKYEVWTDRKSPKNVEEYAVSQQGGYTNDSVIERLQREMTRAEEDYKLFQEQLKRRYELGITSKENYDRELAALRSRKDNYTKNAQQELDVLIARKQTDPLNGGKIFDVTYPKEAVETPIIDAENSHWSRVPFDNVVRDAPNVVTHYKQRPFRNELQTDQIVSAARRNGYGVTHIDNVMDTYNGTMLDETIIGRDTPVKSVLGNTGSFDIESPNKWRLYRSLIPPFLGLGAAAAEE